MLFPQRCCTWYNAHHRGNLTVDEVQDDEGHGGVSGKQSQQLVLSEGKDVWPDEQQHLK